MARNKHEVIISLNLEPDEYPVEGAAWDIVVDEVHALVVRLRDDPRLTAIAADLNPTWALSSDSKYGYDPDILAFTDGTQVQITDADGGTRTGVISSYSPHVQRGDDGNEYFAVDVMVGDDEVQIPLDRVKVTS